MKRKGQLITAMLFLILPCVVIPVVRAVQETVDVIFFYPKDGTQNQSGDPNWYFFWKQTSANCSQNHVYGGPFCNPDTWGYYVDGDNVFHICDRASRDNVTPGLTDSTGIDVFAQTCRHEATHKRNYEAWWSSGLYNPSTDDLDQGSGDRVPDPLEPGLGLDPMLIDTDGDGWRDEHDLAYDAELTWQECSADQGDWSNPGHQLGDIPNYCHYFQ